MTNEPIVFWRLNYANDVQLEQMIASSSVIVADKDFVLGLQIGDGILLAKFNEQTSTGIVKAIGIVSGVNRSTSLPVVTWKRISETLFPTHQGQRFWRQAKPYFKFAKDVVQRYKLKEMFAKHMHNVSLTKVEVSGRSSRAIPILGGVPTESGGYVYVVRSQYGYKIGKTKRMKDRTQLFSVKLPFPIEVVHYAWFDDYSAAELHFHKMFKAKRMEGEWFSLGDGDIATIKRFSGGC